VDHYHGECDAIPEQLDERQCPFCAAVVHGTREEIAHMESEHPEIVEQRLTDAGFVKDENGKWIDTLAADDH
jgi:hypothetical protein